MKTNTKGLKLKPFRYYQFETSTLLKKDTLLYLQFKNHNTINLFEIFQVFSFLSVTVNSFRPIFIWPRNNEPFYNVAVTGTWK